ncbi:MAG: adenosine-specific kinase [bacterium]
MATIDSKLKIKMVRVDIEEGLNVIFGMSHFIKTVEDVYETLIESGPALKFGVAFCEASQKRLVRWDGNDQDMIDLATKAAFDIGCGHSFIVFMKDGFPISVLNRIKNVSEVCRIFCATANPLEVIIAESPQGRGVLGVIDGETPLAIEEDDDRAERMDFLRAINYKRG